MDALASAADFNAARRVILVAAIVFLPITCLIGAAGYTPTWAHRIAERLCGFSIARASCRSRAAGGRIGRRDPAPSRIGGRPQCGTALPHGTAGPGWPRDAGDLPLHWRTRPSRSEPGLPLQKPVEAMRSQTSARSDRALERGRHAGPPGCWLI